MSGDTAPLTVWGVARRPRWVAALVFALALAAGFAALGQWQLERGIESARVIERDTESLRALEEVTSPQQPTNTAADGQRVQARGFFVAGSWIVLEGRSDGSGEADDDGAWVVGRFATDAGGAPAAVAVALGWAESSTAAAAIVEQLDASLADRELIVSGRYLPGEPPQLDDFENGELSSLSPPALVNLWPGPVGEVYGGYIIPDEAAEGLSAIAAPAPSGEVQLNWLNIFYAVEWVVFAGFAIYMWFRLVKDAWERETEIDSDAGSDAAGAHAAGADAAHSAAPVN